jgi:hypothetical protein
VFDDVVLRTLDAADRVDDAETVDVLCDAAHTISYLRFRNELLEFRLELMKRRVEGSRRRWRS